jgi:hypothetical protein
MYDCFIYIDTIASLYIYYQTVEGVTFIYRKTNLVSRFINYIT